MSLTAKQIITETKEAQKEYEFYEERDAVDTLDKKIKIKVKVDTATKESLLRDKEELQKLMDVIDNKLEVIENIK
ncbi:MAG: hypothetical protein ACTSYA_02390 [Candidatus Kariarchaeaceae archaeon]